MTFFDDAYVVSNSEAQTFQDCPRRWWLGWYRGLTPRAVQVSGVRSTGTRYHAALASYYVPDGSAPANPLETLERVQGEDLEALERQTTADTDEFVHLDGSTVVGRERSDLLNQFDLERAMVEGYLEWLAETGVDQDLEIVASEAYVDAPIEPVRGVRVKLIGKLDAKFRSRATGRRGFIDHKTVGSLHDPMLGLNRQMLHYLLIDSLQDGDPLERATEALWNMARKVKRTSRATPPFYARVPITHNQFELDSYRLQLRRVIAQMLETHGLLDTFADHPAKVPARPSRDCAWKCDFFKICRMFDDGSRVEDAVRDLYEVRDPLSYYGTLEKTSE